MSIKRVFWGIRVTIFRIIVLIIVISTIEHFTHPQQAPLQPVATEPKRSADPTADASNAIRAQYNRYCKALDAKEINGVMAIFASDFVETGFEPGKTTYAQYRAQRLKWFASNDSIQSHVDINSIQITGDTATVHIHEGDAVTEPVKLKNGLIQGSIGDSWRIETWKKKEGVWLLSRSKMGK